MSNARLKKLFIAYSPDWVLTIGLSAAAFLLDKVDGFRREFSLTDSSIRFPFAVHERVPDYALYLIAIVAPAVLMPIINRLTIRSWWDFHTSWLGLGLGLSLTGAITQVVKITVGRPRPDLLSRCHLQSGLVDPPYGLTTSAVCNQPDLAMLQDGFRSFFSGHSSLSFAGLGFLSFYLAGKMHLFDHRGFTGKAWLSLTPFMGALLVAISRTMDSRHHWQDVLVGSIVGTVFSYFAYRQYFHPLQSRVSNCPYPPRIDPQPTPEFEGLPTHVVHSEGHDSHHSSYMRLHEAHVPAPSDSESGE